MEPTNKALGQHWLTDEASLTAICNDANITYNDEVLEIGPGLGSLTAMLLACGANVTAVEFDTNLATNLKANVLKIDPHADLARLKIIQSDIRRFDFRSMPTGYKICANIPYYLTSNLLRLISESTNLPREAAILMQKEVTDRIVADDGKMSVISCIMQFYFECYGGTNVPARLFIPPPKVDSRVLILHLRRAPLFDVDSRRYFRLIKAGFSNKRKTLNNALSAGLGLTKENAAKLLEQSKIDPKRRAETLSLNEWKSIYDNLTR